MANVPPEIDAFPPAPQRKNRDTFADLFDGVITWFSTQVAKVGQAALSAYQNCIAAAASATAAGAAAEAAIYTSNAAPWVSGTTYSKYATVYSPINTRTYRRLIAGAGTTDPSLDKTNWELISRESAAMVLLGSATVSSPVANIDFLNVFTDDYSKYVVEIEGLSTNSATNDQPALRLAIAGVVYSGATYLGFSASNGAMPTSQVQLGFGYNISNAADADCSATLVFRNARSTTKHKSVGLTGRVSTTALSAEGGLQQTAALSGFRLQMFSGTSFAAGTVRVYGIRNSQG